MLREIFKQISVRDSPYRDIYYLTDTEIRFTINNENTKKKIMISLRIENHKYNVYGFKQSYIIGQDTNVNNKYQEVITIQDFWQWYNNFYNDIF